MELDYERDIAIDPNALDVEWLRQPALYQQYSDALARADKKIRRLEEKKKTVRSELILKASKKGEKVLGKGVKSTAPNLESYYRTHEDYREVVNEINEMQYERDLIQGAVWAIGHKKVALENLVRLTLGNYFAAPSVPRNLAEEFQKHKSQNAHDRIHASLNRAGKKKKPASKKTKSKRTK